MILSKFLENIEFIGWIVGFIIVLGIISIPFTMLKKWIDKKKAQAKSKRFIEYRRQDELKKQKESE